MSLETSFLLTKFRNKDRPYLDDYEKRAYSIFNDALQAYEYIVSKDKWEEVELLKIEKGDGQTFSTPIRTKELDYIDNALSTLDQL